MAQIEAGTLYEFNKQAMSKLYPLKAGKLQLALNSLAGWFSANLYTKYYMLLCKEKSDYTVFHLNNLNYDKAISEIQEVLDSRGDIVSIDYCHGESAYECWIKERDSEKAFMYMLFPYDWGVVEVE